MGALSAHGPAFLKMHGLGNDFVVFDARREALRLTSYQVQAIADRHIGVGCDQLIVIEPPAEKPAEAFMRIYNADGGEVSACGNATRCVAWLLMEESGKDRVALHTKAGHLDATRADNGRISVDMGPARLDWREIPLSRPADTLRLELNLGPLQAPVAVSMGNPHAVFFVPDAEAVALRELGPQLEHHDFFPERANIGVAQIVARNHIRLRVWERGAGITLACGTGACAALVAAVRRGLAERTADLTLDGGRLTVTWQEDNRVRMTGPVALSFAGHLDASLLSGAF